MGKIRRNALARFLPKCRCLPDPTIQILPAEPAEFRVRSREAHLEQRPLLRPHPRATAHVADEAASLLIYGRPLRKRHAFHSPHFSGFWAWGHGDTYPSSGQRHRCPQRRGHVWTRLRAVSQGVWPGGDFSPLPLPVPLPSPSGQRKRPEGATGRDGTNARKNADVGTDSPSPRPRCPTWRLRQRSARISPTQRPAGSIPGTARIRGWTGKTGTTASWAQFHAGRPCMAMPAFRSRNCLAPGAALPCFGDFC